MSRSNFGSAVASRGERAEPLGRRPHLVAAPHALLGERDGDRRVPGRVASVEDDQQTPLGGADGLRVAERNNGLHGSSHSRRATRTTSPAKTGSGKRRPCSLVRRSPVPAQRAGARYEAAATWRTCPWGARSPVPSPAVRRRGGCRRRDGGHGDSDHVARDGELLLLARRPARLARRLRLRLGGCLLLDGHRRPGLVGLRGRSPRASCSPCRTCSGGCA